MIDFENVFSRGLKGARFLDSNDCVDIFYNHSCRKIEQEEFEYIIDSKARLDIYKLKNTSKNALDFYIATHIGEVFGSGYQGHIAIVSNDKGYKAVQDYWAAYSETPKRIVLGTDIQQSILASNENSERRLVIKQTLGNIDLETEYARYQKKRKQQKKMEEVLAGTGYENLAEKILETMGRENSKRVLYLNMLKQFGRKNGLEIYKRIRNMC